MPFGLTNALANFMDLMNCIFKYSNKFFFVFIDEILIYSRDPTKHEDHLWITLRTLPENKIYVNFSKYVFWLYKVHFLRHLISRDGVIVDQAKIEVISKWPKPTNVIEI